MSSREIKADPFIGPKLKVERAYGHIRDLETRISDFLKSEPYKAIGEVDPQTNQYVIKLAINRPMPAILPLILGDAIQNLRSALDYAACCLAIQRNPAVNINDVAFPIGADAEKFKSLAGEKIKKLAPAAKSFIAQLKPYRGGNDDFWRLHSLGITDRHRLLLVLYAGRGNVVWTITATGSKTGQKVSLPMSLNVADRFEPLEHGSELMRHPVDLNKEGFEHKFEPRIEIAFSDGKSIKDEPIFPTLLQLHDFVKDVVFAIEREFFSKPSAQSAIPTGRPPGKPLAIRIAGVDPSS